MKTIILYLDHAPNYREEFLRQLSQKCNLIVLAHPCEIDDLTPPEVRVGYVYHELAHWGNIIRFNKSWSDYIYMYNPDVICVALNLRYPFRILRFLKDRKLQSKWIWWGQIFGGIDNIIINKIRFYLLSKSAGTLVYTKNIKNRIKLDNITSFNNSQFSENDFVLSNQHFESRLKCLFVGRPQKRKKIEILLTIAEKNKNLEIRLVGPNMNDYFCNKIVPPNVQLFPAAYGGELRNHFNWANLVVNPGHAGLLVMNAATHSRPIVIDEDSKHAPEVILASEADQFFINFNDFNESTDFFERVFQDKDILIKKGSNLFNACYSNYTVEKMVEIHLNVFNSI